MPAFYVSRFFSQTRGDIADRKWENVCCTPADRARDVLFALGQHGALMCAAEQEIQETEWSGTNYLKRHGIRYHLPGTPSMCPRLDVALSGSKV